MTSLDVTPARPGVQPLDRAQIDDLAQGACGHLLAVALEGFTLVHEIGGWDSGDEVRHEVTLRLQGQLGPADALARLGDRFVVFTPEAEPGPVTRLAESLVAVVEPPFEVLGQSVPISAVVGVTKVDEEHDHQDMIHRASSALIRGRSARQNIDWYDAELHRSLVERRRLTNEIRQALEDDRFILLFQPTYDLGSGRYAGAEALLRWEHPQQGLIGPEAFLPTAEQMGLDQLIGSWVLSSAIDQLARWKSDRRREIRRNAPPVLWVNVSGGHVLAPQMADQVLAQLQRAGVEPNRLGIEMTHSAFDDDAPLLLDQLSRLREVGVRIAIDDFGTGKGSFAALRRLPVDVLKIDMSFVHEITSRRGREMVRAILDLARSLDLEVVAEGVESPEQLAALRELGCAMAGGFLLARPVAEAELAQAVDDGQAMLQPTVPGPRRRWWRLGRTRTTHIDDTILDVDLLPTQRDPVTGLGNHRAAIEVIRQDLDAGRRPVLLFIELDSFSATTLMWGTEATDVVLRAEARKLHAMTDARAFRLDGGRFALCLPDSRRGHLSSQVDLVELAKGPKGLTACVGVAHARDGSTPEELEERARQALEAAQRRGHGSVIDHHRDGTVAPQATPAQARALYAVLRAGYLRVHYQPIISLQDDAVTGYQALARPQLDHGLTGPAEALQVAAALGLVPEIDAVCRASIFVDGPGFDLPARVRLFVSIAPQALGHRSLRSGQLIRQVHAAGLDPARVVWQLRESPAVPAEIFDQEARWLKECGFGIALEDAGGETSGLRALAAVPFDVVKLAPSLLTRVGQDESAAALVEAIANFCQRAGSEIIATGIETSEQLSTARRLRRGPNGAPWISSAQGYLLGKPRPQLRVNDDRRAASPL